ncbi:MAG: oligosaccharide flippase family protein [Bacteroidota bacterium]
MTVVKKNKLIWNFFSLGVVQAMIALLQLIVIPHVIKKIGIDGFGVVAVAQVVILYLSVFTDFGFNQTATREVSLYRSDRQRISKIFFRVLFSKLVLCFFAFIILLILVLLIPVFRAHALLYLIAFVFVLGQSSLVTWLFLGFEKMQFIALLTLAGRVIFVILVFVFIRNKAQDFLFLFFLGLGTLISGVASIFSAYRLFKLEFIKPSRDEIVQELKEGWHVTIANLSIYTCQYANIFILRIFTNDLAVGYFSIAERVFFTIKQVLTMFSQVAYPGVCQLVQSGKEFLISFWKQIYIPFLFCVISGCLLIFIFSPQVLYFFMRDEYFHSVFFLRMMCVASVIVCLNIPGTLTLLAMDKRKIYFRIVTIGMVLNIVSNLVLVQLFKGTGTIISIFITEFFMAAGLGFEAFRHLRSNENSLKPV